MSKLNDLIERLRELGEFPHDVAGAQSDIQQAASALQSLVDRNAAMESALKFVVETRDCNHQPAADTFAAQHYAKSCPICRARSALPPEAVEP